MGQTHFAIYDESETLYVSSFGIEQDGKEAFWGPGRRNQCVIHYILSGSGYFNGIKAHVGQGFYFGAGELIEYYPDAEEPWNYFWIDCSEEFARRYILPSIMPDENGIFSYNFKSRLELIINKVFGFEQPMSIVESLGFAFSVLMLHEQHRKATKSQYFVQQAKRYMDYSLNRRITVSDVAQELSINDRYLYTLFMKHEGVSPKEYILRRKIDAAADLLINTSLSIKEISQAVGITDIYSFSKLFKSRMGVSPTKYREMTY